MEKNIEGQGRVIKAEQILCKAEMTRAADRQKLRNSLEGAQEQSVKKSSCHLALSNL